MVSNRRFYGTAEQSTGKTFNTVRFVVATIISALAGIVSVVRIAIGERQSGKKPKVEGAYLEDKSRTIAFYRTFSRFYDSVNPSFYSDGMRSLAVAEARILPGSLMLDVGCGTGYTTQALDRADPVGAIAGLDLTPQQLGKARSKVRNGDLHASLTRGDADHLPFPDAAFDAAVSIGALEYFPDPAHTVAELARIVRPGGRVVVGGPERAWFRRFSLDRFLYSPAREELENFFQYAGLVEVGSTLTGMDTYLGTAGYVVFAYGTVPKSLGSQ